MSEEFATPPPALLATLGTHKRNRPLTPLEAAKEIRSFLEKGGRPEQLPVSGDTIKEFLSLLKLSSSVQKMLGWGGVEKGEIGMYSGSWISRLKRAEDQEVLAKAVLERKLTSTEVRRIVRYKNRLREKPIEECIEAVVATRPIERHLFITQLNGESLRKLEREADARGVSAASLLREILSKELPSNSLISLALKGDFVMLFLEEEGNEALLRRVKELRVPLKEVVDAIVSKRL